MKHDLHSIDEGIGFQAICITGTTSLEQSGKRDNIRAVDISVAALLKALKDLRRNAVPDLSARVGTASHEV